MNIAMKKGLVENGMSGRKHSQETKDKISNIHKGRDGTLQSEFMKEFLKEKQNHPMFGKSQTTDAREKMSNSSKAWRSKMSDEDLEKQRAHLLSINKGGRTKNFLFDGEILQGTYELYYKINNPSVLKNKIYIKTPFGLYMPDFDDGEKYLEIKCGYTLLNSIKRGQFEKIKWINSHMDKKIKIIILKQKIVDSFLSKYDLKELLYKPN